MLLWRLSPVNCARATKSTLPALVSSRYQTAKPAKDAILALARPSRSRPPKSQDLRLVSYSKKQSALRNSLEILDPVFHKTTARGGCFDSGAGRDSRTPILSLENYCMNRYTIPAVIIYL